MWPEFVRKITILLLFDRLNSTEFKPKYCELGPWNSNTSSRELIKTPSEIKIRNYTNEKINKKSEFGFTKYQPNLSRLSYVKHKLCIEEDEIQEIEPDVSLKVSELMSKNIELDSYRPYHGSNFGSYNYVIRSKHLNNNDLDDSALFSEDEDDYYKLSDINSKNFSSKNRKGDFNYKYSKSQAGQLKSISFNVGSEKHKKFDGLSKNIFSNNLNSSSFNMKSNHLKSDKDDKFKNESLNNWYDGQYNSNNNKDKYIDETDNLHNETKYNQNQSISLSDFNYSKVTNDIYKNFGKNRNSFNYPQYINHASMINKSKKQNKHGEGSNEDLNFDQNITNLSDSLNFLAKTNTFKEKLNFPLLNNQLLTNRSSEMFNLNAMDKKFMHLNKDSSNLNLLNQYATNNNLLIRTSKLLAKF